MLGAVTGLHLKRCKRVDGFPRAVHAVQSIIVRSGEVIIMQRKRVRERGGKRGREEDKDTVSSRATLLSPLAS